MRSVGQAAWGWTLGHSLSFATVNNVAVDTDVQYSQVLLSALEWKIMSFHAMLALGKHHVVFPLVASQGFTAICEGCTSYLPHHTSWYQQFISLN